MISPIAGPGALPKPAPWSQARRPSISAWASQATSRVARSMPIKPGMTRRTGSTIQFESAVTNCPTGLRKGARSTCIQKRSSTTNTNSPNTVWMSRLPISFSIFLFLPELFAELLAAVVRGVDRANDRVLHFVLGHAGEGALGRAALRGHPFAQDGDRVRAAGREPGRAGEGVER